MEGHDNGPKLEESREEGVPIEARRAQRRLQRPKDSFLMILVMEMDSTIRLNQAPLLRVSTVAQGRLQQLKICYNLRYIIAFSRFFPQQKFCHFSHEMKIGKR